LYHTQQRYLQFTLIEDGSFVAGRVSVTTKPTLTVQAKKRVGFALIFGEFRFQPMAEKFDSRRQVGNQR
jgi:hypothetical protein